MFEDTRILSFIYLFIIPLSSCQRSNIPIELIIDRWEFCQSGGDWFPADVPGSVHLDLFENNLIESPFYRTNELDAQWVEDKKWSYRSYFEVSSEIMSMDKVELYFSGIDTYARVYLNDSLVQSCNNFFLSYSLDVKSLLKSQNILRFDFQPAQQMAINMQNEAPYDLPGGERVFVRKPQFHFGWDWGPRLLGCGITENVSITAFNIPQIIDIYVETISIIDSTAVMSAQVELSHWDSDSFNIQFNGNSYPISQSNHSFVFEINNAELWWPIGYGKQFFYPLDLTLEDKQGDLLDEVSEKFAVRQIHLIQEADDLGKGFKFQVNGDDVYAMGANFIPLDFFHTRVDSKAYRIALNDVISANMNMLRVWGGGIYEDDYFYELCDSLGIMVWQDFMFACGMYPGDSIFISSVEHEATQQIKRLRKHPSISLWCGNNENSEGWNRWSWQSNRSELEKKNLWKDYQSLFSKLLPDLVHSLSATDYWESSPQFGRGNPKHQFMGDAHYWGVWHDAEPFEEFQNKVPRFMSEYGFQSFPEMDAIDLYSLPEDHHLNSEVMRLHQKHPRGNQLIKDYMARDYKDPQDFEAFIYLSQSLQAKGMTVGIESHRRSKPYNMGTLYWQFNDCWPAVSWSSRDYYGNWKQLHYAVQRAYKDLLISTIQTSDSIYFYLTNDNFFDNELTLTIDHVNYQGDILQSLAKKINVFRGESVLIESIELSNWISSQGIDTHSYLDIKLNHPTKLMARKLHHFVKPKQMDLICPSISFKSEKDSLGFIIELFSNTFLKDLRIGSMHDGRFEDNYFDLPANEHRRIRFFNTYPMDTFNENTLTFFSIVDTYE